MGKDNSQNHCAHFVSHVMEYEFAETCKNYTSIDKQTAGNGAVIRVDTIFNVCPDAGPWGKRPLPLATCLIFVTMASNIIQSGPRYRMKDQPNKHIGIFINGAVWHYSNGGDKVIVDSEKVFIGKFNHQYRAAGQAVVFFYGDFLK